MMARPFLQARLVVLVCPSFSVSMNWLPNMLLKLSTFALSLPAPTIRYSARSTTHATVRVLHRWLLIISPFPLHSHHLTSPPATNLRIDR